jgi:hypothetical protein
MRKMFGWDLPPGVTQKMIDDQGTNLDPEEELNAIEQELENIDIRIKELHARMVSLLTLTRTYVDKSISPQQKGAHTKLWNKVSKEMDINWRDGEDT